MECVLTGVVEDITAVFSDIDGTLGHYAKTLVPCGYVKLTAEEADSLKWPPPPCNDVEELLDRCFPSSARQARFRGLPFEFWRHVESGKVIKTYGLYSKTLTGGAISENTVLLVELLQQREYLYNGLPATEVAARTPVLFSLITGARTSTYTNRRVRGTLPLTAYDSSEGGGKLWCRLRQPREWLQGKQLSTEEMFLPNDVIPPCDGAWALAFSDTTGYGTPIDETKRSEAPLWRAAALLESQGFLIDHVDYDTSFLVNLKESPCVVHPENTGAGRLGFPSTLAAETYLKETFASEYSERFNLELFVNLGKAQVNAKGSGKKGVMYHIMKVTNEADPSAHDRFSAARSVALFDDHNDLPFAEACGAGILPSVAHEDVLAHAQWAGEHKKWFRPPFDGLLGSEWALSQIVVFKRRAR